MLISSVTTAETDALDKPLVTLLTCYMTGSTEGRNLGTAGYSHDFVAKLYAPILEQWGEVIAVANPKEELDLVVDKVLAEGKQPVHVSVLPLQDVTLATKAPNVAIPAWEFPDVPNEVFGDNPQSSWPPVANACDLVLVSGPFTVRSLRKGGAVSPMRIVPVPTPDAYFDLPSWRPHQTKIVHCRGYVFPQQRPPIVPPTPAPLPPPPLPVARTPEPEPVPVVESAPPLVVECVSAPVVEPFPPPVAESVPPPVVEAIHEPAPPVVESVSPPVVAPPPAVEPPPSRRNLIRKAGRSIEWSVRRGALYVMGPKGYDDFARTVWGRKPKSERTPKPMPTPIQEVIPDPVQEVTPAPIPEPVSPPTPESIPEPVQEAIPAPAPEPTPEPVQESAPEPTQAPPVPPLVSIVHSVLNSPEARNVAVNDLYRRYLRRPADPGGLKHWSNMVAGGATYQEVSGCLFGSPEYFQLHGATNEAFLKALYMDVLGREIEPAEQAHYAAQLNGASPEAPPPPREARVPYDSVAQIELSGVVFTSIFNPDDGRKNWCDLLTACLLALADRDDATIVFKLISSNPASTERVIKWYLDRDIVHKCKVVFISEFLSDSQMCELAEASTYYVQATKAEGNCLPLMNYLAAGRPGVSPNHSSMGDYFGEDSGFVVESHQEPAAWPHDPRLRHRTTWGRIVWTSLRDQIDAAYRMAAEDTGGYLRLSLRCRRKMKAWASIPAVAARLLGAIGELLAGQLTKRPDDAETRAAVTQSTPTGADPFEKVPRLAGLKYHTA